MSWNRNNTIAAFVREQRKLQKLNQSAFASLTGVGLRFLRELEQGKPNLELAKVNQVLSFFGHEVGPVPIQTENP